MKIKFGLDVDLTGNHGKWRHEETRFLDRGEGLHGRTFELTQAQFDVLGTHFLNLEKEENTAIEEIAGFLKLKPKEKPRIYAYEDDAPFIFAIEKKKAKEEGREPRLKPFELRAALGLGGPHLRNSSTCKSQALCALNTVLTTEQIDELSGHGKHASVPRLSGDMENIYLHSTGPLSNHTKKSGAKVHFRKELGTDGVRLFWTVPPQNCDFLTPESSDLCSVDPEYCSQIKNLVKKLQRLEWALYNAEVPEQYKVHKEKLIQKVIKAYEGFSSITPKPDNKKISGWFGYALYLLAQPRSATENDLQQKIGSIRLLLNSIYMAMVDAWKIVIEEVAVQGGQTEELANEEGVDAVASYLSKEDKQGICKILGRNYVEPDSDLDGDYEADDELTSSEDERVAPAMH